MPFSEKQRDYIKNATHRWNIKVGATRSGKTFLDYYLIPKRIRERTNKPGISVIMGVTQTTVKRNILEPMEMIWGKSFIGNTAPDGTCLMFGERVHIMGAEKVSAVSKIRGTSIKYCYGDEVADWNKDVFELLKSRLDKEYSLFDGALNPQGPNHWLKDFLDSGTDIYKQHYTIFDNPFLPSEFVSNLCEEYAGSVYYDRYILGEWALAEGLVYPNYNEAFGTMPTDKQVEEICLSIDYGTQNAFACIFWAKVDGVWYGIEEYYHSGRTEGIQKTDDEYGNDIDSFVVSVMDKYSDSMKRVADSEGLLNRPIGVIIDPSAASFITLLRRKPHYKVYPADNAVVDGIRETASAMHRGLIKISPRMKNWQKEISGYVWNDNAIEDVPVKEDDHLMDAMRYFVKTKKIVKKTERYTPFIYR